MPNMFKVQAAPLLYTSKQIRFQISACVCFCNMPRVRKSVDYRTVGCRSLYCITLYRFVQGNNFKMTPFAPIYRDGM